MEKVCYWHAAQEPVCPGFQVWPVRQAEGGWWVRWWKQAPPPGQLVYRPRCRLTLEDLELASVMPQASARGAWCWCDLLVQVDDPEALFGQLAELMEGQWVVTVDRLQQWFRPRLADLLENLAKQRDLTNEASWPGVEAEVVQKLSCAPGVSWDRSLPAGQPPPPGQSPFILRKVLSYEQYLEILTLKQELRVRLEQLQRDAQMAILMARHGVEQLLQRLQEERFAPLLTEREKALSAEERFASLVAIAGPAGGRELRAGVQLGNFQLLSQLGQGGQAQVWKARDRMGDRIVVVKLIPPEVPRAAGEMDRLRECFRKIHALHHQHICPVLLLDQDPRFGWYWVMQYVEGQTLRTYRAGYVAQHGSFPVAQVVKVLWPVAQALDYAHSQGIIHRDIKPENILVVGDAEDVQLVDFGLAAEIRTSLSRLSQVQMETSGTPPYMAPEQWRGDLQDAKTDQYALAVVAYELLAGRLPFDGANPSILRPCVLQEPPKPIQGLSEEINRALLRGLAKIPHQRFSTCQEFIKAIEQGERETMSILEVRLVSINTEAKRKGDRFQFHITIEGENWSNCTLGLSGLTVNIPSVATTDTYNTIELKTRSAGCKPPYHFKTGEMIWGFLENGSFGRKPAECLFIESVLDEWEPNKRIKLEADILAPFRRMEAHVRVWATQRTSNGGTKAFGDPKWSDTQIRDQQGMPAYSLSIGFD